MKASKLIPNFEVTNIKNTVVFYQENFDFELVDAVPETLDGSDKVLDKNKEYVFAMMKKDDIELMFQRSDSFKEDVVFSKTEGIGASASFYIHCTGIDDLYSKLKNKKFEMTELKTTWYGMTEFYIKDLNGYILCFGEKAE